MDQFLVVLIADGYMNIGGGKEQTEGKKRHLNFKDHASKKGFFKYDYVDDIFTKADKNIASKRHIMSI
jgi:hypothetical protein